MSNQAIVRILTWTVAFVIAGVLDLLLLWSVCLALYLVGKGVTWAMRADAREKGNRIADDEIEVIRQFHQDFDKNLKKLLRRGE